MKLFCSWIVLAVDLKTDSTCLHTHLSIVGWFQADCLVWCYGIFWEQLFCYNKKLGQAVCTGLNFEASIALDKYSPLQLPKAEHLKNSPQRSRPN
jgi:hypothetical protein